MSTLKGTTALLNNPNVKQLTKTFDLKTPFRLNVCDYEFDNGFIIINNIELINDKGEHVRYVDLEKVLPYLEESLVSFALNG
jgi:hypothetical protein